MDTAATSGELLDELVNHKMDFFCGVPDSIMGNLIAQIEERGLSYIPATCEDVAVGVAAGAHLGGKRPCVIMQNSGLGNAVDSYMTLVKLYRIPVLFMISVPAVPSENERPNYIQHIDWEKLTLPLLDAIEFPYVLLSRKGYRRDIERAVKMMEKKIHPTALIIRKGYLDEKR